MMSSLSAKTNNSRGITMEKIKQKGNKKKVRRGWWGR
jgi:hypothetical protein